ncbi:preprotein translocase subunit SecY [Lacrimispora sp.]|uniref:preprotein translocase subunit SecY n=1 Tax=Lacrimispora sp. TaxID=2719234 RepID=UPI0034604551
MFKTLRNAFKVKEVRMKLIYTFMMLVVIRIGSQLPIPGVNTEFFKEFFAQQNNDAMGFFNAMTGSSFSNMSVFALSISPYITSSIIMQLLTIAIPKLEEMQKDGEDGRKKIAEYTRYVTVGLALIESVAMAIGFGGQGLLREFNALSIIIAVVTMTAGSALLMWIGERITEKGVGNGISIVLMVNIISSFPSDVSTLYNRFMSGKSVAVAAIAAIIIIAVILAIIVFVIVLQDGERRIPVQYSKKMQGRKMVGGQATNIPLKVNTAGVIPVIFASSLMSFPVVISQFFGDKIDYSSIGGHILTGLNSSSWFKPDRPAYSIGLILYVALIIVFAYFYTSITFNPLEVANNMKKSGGFIPGIRPGKPTSDYLNSILNYIVFIGACSLTIVCVIPIMVSGLFNVSRLSFGGTSLIIIVSVVLETIKAIESQMLVRYYKGFLND